MAKSNIEKAIEVFNGHLKDLETVNSKETGKIFKAALTDSAVKYLGKDSALVNSISNSFLSPKEQKWSPGGGGILPFSTESNVYRPENKEIFKNIINQIINSIKTNGVFGAQIENQNFLCRFSNGQLISAVVVIIGAAYALISGTYNFGIDVGEAKKERENNILIRENETLKKEIEYQVGTIKNYEQEVISSRKQLDSIPKLIPKPKIDGNSL